MPPDADLPPLLDLLPHRPPMVLLDAVLALDATRLEAAVRIGPGTAFLRPPGEVPVWIGLEYMAQAVAAHTGARRRDAGQPVRPGLLLGTRRCDCAVDAFPLGADLRVVVELDVDSGETAGYRCRIVDTQTQAELMSANLTVHLPATTGAPPSSSSGET